MTNIQYLIQVIKRVIDREILHITFANEIKENRYISLDRLIEINIIRPYLLVDINIIDGIEMKVPLEACNEIYRDDYCVSYEIPPAILGNRKILSVSALVLSDINTGSYGTGEEYKADIKSSLEDVSGDIITDITVVGNYEVMVNSPAIVGTGYFKLQVEHDARLSDVQRYLLKNFRKAVTYAAKAYIYRKLHLRLAKGSSYRGHDLNALSNIVEEYKADDMMELYYEEIDKNIGTALFINDEESMSDFISKRFNNIL